MLKPKQYITKDGKDLTLYPYYSLHQKQEILKERLRYDDIRIKGKWQEIVNCFKKAFNK